MAGEPKEEFPPLLPVGFHEFDIAGLRRMCVERFPQSITRPAIMRGLEELLELLNKNGMRGEVWVNGSFTTEKLNPDDCDLIFMTSMDVVRAFTPAQRNFYEWFNRVKLKSSHRCDNYALAQDENHPASEWFVAYWLRQFGFSRTDEMKGLAVVKIPFLVTV